MTTLHRAASITRYPNTGPNWWTTTCYTSNMPNTPKVDWRDYLPDRTGVQYRKLWAPERYMHHEESPPAGFLMAEPMKIQLRELQQLITSKHSKVYEENGGFKVSEGPHWDFIIDDMGRIWWQWEVDDTPTLAGGYKLNNTFFDEIWFYSHFPWYYQEMGDIYPPLCYSCANQLPSRYFILEDQTVLSTCRAHMPRRSYHHDHQIAKRGNIAFTMNELIEWYKDFSRRLLINEVLELDRELRIGYLLIQ